jgi:hypothetical protein
VGFYRYQTLTVPLAVVPGSYWVCANGFDATDRDTNTNNGDVVSVNGAAGPNVVASTVPTGAYGTNGGSAPFTGPLTGITLDPGNTYLFGGANFLFGLSVGGGTE